MYVVQQHASVEPAEKMQILKRTTVTQWSVEAAGILYRECACGMKFVCNIVVTAKDEFTASVFFVLQACV